MLKKKTVVLCLRDNKLDNSFRNSNFSTYIDSINYLLKKKFNIIFFSEKRIYSKIKHKNFFNICFENISLKDQFIIYKLSTFNIVNLSGPAGYSALINTPFLLTNDINYYTSLVVKNSDRRILKKIFKSNKIVTLKEIYKKNFKYQGFKTNLLYKSNSSREILYAVKEMLNIIKTKNFNTVSKKQNKYQKLLNKKIDTFYTQSKISNSFFQLNNNLLK